MNVWFHQGLFPDHNANGREKVFNFEQIVPWFPFPESLMPAG
jgi:hypothetical protein